MATEVKYDHCSIRHQTAFIQWTKDHHHSKKANNHELHPRFINTSSLQYVCKRISPFAKGAAARATVAAIRERISYVLDAVYSTAVPLCCVQSAGMCWLCLALPLRLRYVARWWSALLRAFERRSECTSKTRELSQLITYPPIGSPHFFVVHKSNFELNRNSEMAPFLTLYYVSITRSATPLFFLPIKTRTTSLLHRKYSQVNGFTMMPIVSLRRRRS